MNLPRLMTEDFNQVLEATEKRGGNRLRQRRVKPLRDMLDTCKLMDMRFIGPQYTWSNIRSGPTSIEERLECCFCNAAWLHYFPSSMVCHLPRIRLDHHPLLIQSSTPPSIA